MENATIEIAGMRNQQCTQTIAQALMAVSGVEKADVALENHRASVTFDASLTNKDQLKKTIRDAGYVIKPAHGEDGNCCGGCGG